MSIKPYPIYVRRKGRWVTVNSDELLPGDLVSIGYIHLFVINTVYFHFRIVLIKFYLIYCIVRSKEDGGVPCDMVLVNGTCIVNEAMLSGESTPLLKVGYKFTT